MQTTLLLAAAAGLGLGAGALFYAGLRIGRARGGMIAPSVEEAPVAARRLVGAWQGRQGYAFALAISNSSAGDVLIEGVEVLAPARARVSVQPGDDESWTRPARRQAVRWRAAAGKREAVVQCRLHLPASADRTGTRALLRLTGTRDAGGRRTCATLTVDL
ncbi:hypothetical protein [Methylobacterium radiodurans]|uniref:Uncharacterized protein n=1 Tax=Methylobacterium radiodurans TaxID=2202828 RepID=A0A2U8VUT2_9HYPH|nr:hypothetical protein [Methylobacterium radiodurans]AWN37544.1 hypothetical protein DK427_18910 [Methylobacterium radiodurans]